MISDDPLQEAADKRGSVGCWSGESGGNQRGGGVESLDEKRRLARGVEEGRGRRKFVRDSYAFHPFSLFNFFAKSLKIDWLTRSDAWKWFVEFIGYFGWIM